MTQEIKEEHRDARGTGFIEETGRDIRDAARQLTRSPGLTVAVAVSVGLGIGGTAAMSSLMDAVLADARSFVAVGAYSVTGLSAGHERPERLRAAAVTPGFFEARAARNGGMAAAAGA